GDDIFTIQPDPATIYYMYNMVQMFFQNGGAVCYIVSVGTYGPASGAGTTPGDNPSNDNVKATELQAGLKLLEKVPEVTMYVIPEATLLSDNDNQSTMQQAVAQAAKMQTCMPILDVKGGWEPDPILWTESIDKFRNAVGNNSLKWACAYWPYLKTSVMTIDQFDFKNVNGGDVSTLDPILNNATATTIIQGIQAGNGMSDAQNNAALMQASPIYKQIMNLVQGLANIIPPSGCMAGVWALTDTTTGVFKAPANVTPLGVTDLTLPIDDSEQAGLNVDAMSGKSINAIRFFNGNGILVWGARTLDGNSQDWRYINVRRTVTMIEQSLKLALRSYVFDSNDSITWQSVISMAQNFLTNQWQAGALQGATPEDAFSVACGLGITMTPQDILDGYLRLTIKLAVVRPAEFIVLTVQQQMAKS
ncbi:MAG TPA: phage tail protein, partial [Cytophagales bacterium]|nr:phage tail protein [Cytophagales bacterium]